MTLPTDYGNLTGWWDASQESFANNDPVPTFTDRSGNGRDLTQASSVLRPIFTTGVFPLGGPGLDFKATGGTAEFLIGAAISNFITDSAYTLFAVVLVDTIATDSGTIYSNDAIWSDDGGYAGTHLRSTGPVVIGYNWDGGVQSASTAMSTGSAFVYQQRHESGNVYISVNGGTEASVASGTTDVLTGVFQMGRASGAQFLNGKIGEFFVYSAARSTGEISALNTYLAAKWITPPPPSGDPMLRVFRF